MERFNGGQMSVVDDMHLYGHQLYIKKLDVSNYSLIKKR
jgi:hypothetical protein